MLLSLHHAGDTRHCRGGPLANTPLPGAALTRSPSIGNLGALVLSLAAAIGVVQFYKPDHRLGGGTPFANLAKAMNGVVPAAAVPTTDAFGVSGAVKVRFALPGEPVELPLAVGAGTQVLTYQWALVGDSTPVAPAAPLTASPPMAPREPGFYNLIVTHDGVRETIAEPTLAVMVPFERKLGGWLNGYRLGTYVAERLEGRHDKPAGFVEVRPEQLGLQVSTHLKLADFVTHDDQGDVWPKYVALNPRLLDKLELVLADLGQRSGRSLAVDVHSGFRSPSHNTSVRRSARDSRHQYGDAADIQIDADGDGRITMTDELLVMLAVERVELRFPDLVGGLGLYTSRRYRTPYLHIDARGRRSRWHG